MREEWLKRELMIERKKKGKTRCQRSELGGRLDKGVEFDMAEGVGRSRAATIAAGSRKFPCGYLIGRGM